MSAVPERLLGDVAAAHPALRALVLFGSRARGAATPGSDWDLAYLAEEALDPLALRADLAAALSTDAVDVVDLARAGALLRFRVARDGRALLERAPGEYRRFQLEAISFWCDAGPIIRRGYDSVLEMSRDEPPRSRDAAVEGPRDPRAFLGRAAALVRPAP